MRAILIASLSIGMLVLSPSRAVAAPPPWYPPLLLLPADPENYEEGRAGTPITRIVIHATGGRFVGAVSWFQDPRSKVSAHYVIRASDGAVTQMVAEKDTAFHVRGATRSTIGIEHEFDPSSGVEFADALYRSSARLACAIARRYGIPRDRAHILGHSEIAGSDHVDPGPTWNWSYYMDLVDTECSSLAGAPRPTLTAGDSGPSVALLQWQLAYLGLMDEQVVLAGGGMYGPRTGAAVRAFQAANAVPSTGTYGPLTANALARSLERSPSRAAPAGLSIGSRSDDVTVLQRDLERLGYTDPVTGYCGPVTERAVRRFQEDHAIDATGTYGPLTRAAMSLRTR